jgi:hypothetical protein
MLTRPLQAGEREESGELFWSCHASNAVSFRTAPHDPSGLSPMPNGSPSPGSWLSTPGCGVSPETARSNPSASALTSAPSAASSSRSYRCGSARPTLPFWRASWRRQESSRCAPLPGDVSILTQVVAKNIRDLHRITRSILAVDGVVAAAPPSPRTRSSPAGRTPCSASPPAPGADPYDPSPALNSRRSLYSLRQWRDSHQLLFDRELARWTSQ